MSVINFKRLDPSRRARWAVRFSPARDTRQSNLHRRAPDLFLSDRCEWPASLQGGKMCSLARKSF